MLPKLTNSQSNSVSQLQTVRTDMKKSTISKINKGMEQVANLEEKYQNELNLNSKLKTLLANVKANMDTNMKIYEQQQQTAKLVKEKRKWENDVQHQANTLNSLIAQNSKLKEAVNAERNKRAIYFNVYKNLEHEIHEWESKYKNLLIEGMKAEGAISKVKDKFKRAIKKVEKDIQSLNQQISQMNKQSILQDSKPVSARTKISKAALSQLPEIGGEQGLKITKNINFELREVRNMEKSANVASNQNRKSGDVELEYQIEQKSIQVSGVLSRLKSITGKSQLSECVNVLKNIDEQIQYNFSLFREEETRQKQLLAKLHQYEDQLQKIEDENEQKKLSNPKIEGQDEIKRLNEQISEMEKQLGQKIGIKVNELSNQMLLHHCLRIRDENQENKRNLQKNLQQTKKEKSQCNMLLTPKQMHKRIILSQTKMI